MRVFLLFPALIASLCAAESGPLQLSLKRAVDLATSPEGSARIQIAGEGIKQAQARSGQARAALLPNVDGYTSWQNVTRNLQAVGIIVNLPFPNFQFPTLVGPFNVIDIRATGSQTIFDLTAIRRFQAAKVGIGAARAESDNAAEQVAAQTARAYIAAVRAEADVATVKANIELAQAILKQAEDQKKAGTGTGLEITRARVQLANEEQRLLVAENGRDRARLELLRTIGLRLDTEFVLTDPLEYVPVDATTLEQARALAVKARPDLKAQQERESSARLSASATKLERVPGLAAIADYGTIGNTLSNAFPTRTYGLSLRLPVFDGGRRDARRAEAESQFRAERVRTNDLKDQIELEVRLALDALASADRQVQVAKEGLALAEAETNQARRRYDAGVANSLEVTDAQTRLERARDNSVAALYNYNVARIDLAQATGSVRRLIP
jgi:outer membrane protein TolC